MLRRFYLRQGYADVQITGATAELAPDRSGFFLTYTIDEGPRYRIGKIEVTSTLRGLDPAALQREIPISVGEWYDGDAVERADTATDRICSASAQLPLRRTSSRAWCATARRARST